MQTEVVLKQPQGKKALRFIGHFFEMLVVMMLGMCVLGGAFGELHGLLFGSGFADAWRDHVVLAALAMGFNMTMPMVLWMRYGGHSWERGGEMVAAMNLPLPPLLVFYAFGAIPAQGVLGLQMMLMIPAMLGVMLYRKDEYGAPHHRTRHLALRRWFAEAR